MNFILFTRMENNAMQRIVYTFLLLTTVMSVAFAGSGKISGRVVDAATNEPLIGASVLIVGTTLGASADIEGKYIILNVPAGTYDMKVSFIGYQDVLKKEVRVSADLTLEENFSLRQAGVEVKGVEIIAERPMINKSATNVVRIATQEELKNLPLRGVVNAVALQPGVVMQEERGTQKLYIRGGRSDEVGYYVEGVATRNVLTGDNATTVIPEALEEFQVHAGGYTAEYGGANAGIVRQQLRSGGSVYRASFQSETDNLNLSQGFLKHAPNEKFLGAYGYGYVDNVLTFSGPVLSDHVKVFIAGENQFQRDTQVRFVTPFRFENLVEDIESRRPYADRETLKVLEYGGGNIPGTMKNRYALNGTVAFDFSPFVLRAGGTFSWQRERINDSPIQNMFDQMRLPVRDQSDGLMNLKLSHVLSPTMYYEVNFNYFDFRSKTYDPLFGDDFIHYKDSSLLAQKGLNTNWTYTQSPSDYRIASFIFHRPGALLARYSKTSQTYVGGSADFTSQFGSHEVKVGGNLQRYTVRSYRLGRRPDVPPYIPAEEFLSNIRNNPDLYRDRGAYDPVTQTFERDVNFMNAGDFISAYGYDVYGNILEDGFDGPRHPAFGAFYIQDKLEMSDLIINAGLRLDIIDADDFQFRDFIDAAGIYGNPGAHYSTTNPLVSSANKQIIPAGMEKKKAFKQFSPRLGFSFPVSDRTVFHVQYGKFLQAPQLSTLYGGRGPSALAFGGGFFTPQPIGYGLDPERTTQYEIGFTQQFSDFSVFDITGFYKDIQGQIQAAKITVDPTAIVATYNTLQNGDYATTKGIELRLSLRRIARIQAQANYTLSDAQGTGSSPYSAVAGIDVGTPRPTVISPLGFNQTHRLSLNLDYRFGEDDGGPILSQLGANLLLTANSGHNFTLASGSLGQRDAMLGGILADDDPRTRKPLEEINASTTPWVFLFDVRVDKSVRIAMFDLNIYVYVQNLLNTQNVTNVYNRTGNAYDDGFLTNSELSGKTVDKYGQQYADFYKAVNLGNRQHYALTQGGDLFGTPRQIRLGVRLDY